MFPICPITISALKPKPNNYPTSLNTLADHLLAKRLDLRLSKTNMAKILNVMSISGWEFGYKKPVPKMMKKIIKFLGYIPPLDIDKNTLGGRLFTYRMVNGLTQSEVALYLKVDHWAICKIENNQEVDERYKTKVKSLLQLENQNYKLSSSAKL